jgi:Icc-related predicted phosphoesterase
MKILTISDTHNQHSSIPSRFINNEDGSIDTIIHAGDMTSRGYKSEVLLFLNWFGNLPFKNKILIAGNHDFWFEEATNTEVKDTLSYFDSIIYLRDSGVEIDGIKFWGSPVQPWFYDWAFNKAGETIKPHWDMIPLDTNVLVTHGPIKGFLDMTMGGESVGCPYLRDRVAELKDLKLHVCGHIHEGYGRFETGNGVILVNASVLNHRYYMTNEPIIIEISNEKQELDVT